MQIFNYKKDGLHLYTYPYNLSYQILGFTGHEVTEWKTCSFAQTRKLTLKINRKNMTESMASDDC